MTDEPKTEAPESVELSWDDCNQQWDSDPVHIGPAFTFVRLDLVAALLATLPACDNHPDRPATRAMGRGTARFCDECGTRDPDYPVDEYPLAPALRRLVALVGKEDAK